MRPLTIAILFILAVSSFGLVHLKSSVSPLQLMDSRLAEVLEYKKSLGHFPYQKNLIARVTKLDGTKISMAELARIKTWAGQFDDAVSIFNLRLPDHNPAQSTLHYPTVLSPVLSPGTTPYLERTGWKDFFLGKDGKSLLLVVLLPQGVSSQSIDSILNAPPGLDGLKVEWTGTAAFESFAQKGLAHAGLLNLAMFAILFIGLFFLFGNIRTGVVALSGLAVAIAAVMGGMGWAGHPIDSLSANLSFLLVISLLEDIFLVFYFAAEEDGDLNKAFRKLRWPCFFTSLTTAVGFASLGVSDLPTVQRFALWSTIGTLVEWVVIFYLVPSLAARLIPGKIQLTGLAQRLRQGIQRWRPAPWLAVASLLFLLALPWAARNLNYNTTPFEIFPPGHPALELREKILETRGWEHQIELHFSPGTGTERKQQILSQAQKTANVTWAEHPETFLYPQYRAQLNEDIWSLVLSELQAAGGANRYFSGEEERAFIYLKSSDVLAVASTAADLRRICATDCRPTGELLAFGSYSKTLIATLMESFAVSMVLILLTIAALMWKWRATNRTAVILSILWGPAMILILFAASDVAVSLVNCVLVSLAVGLSGDSAIQFIYNSRGQKLEETLSGFGVGPVFLFVFLILLCTPMLFSAFGNVRVMALLLMAGLALMIFGEYFVLRGMLSQSLKIFNKGKAKP